MDLIRFILVLACMAPLFILLAIRGVGAVSWEVYFPICIALAVLPNIYLLFRVRQADSKNDRKEIVVKSLTDNRDQLLTYIFAMLIPLYQSSMATDQDLAAALASLLFVIFIFGHMEIYYMNFFLAAFGGYRVLTLSDASKFSATHVLITKKRNIQPGDVVLALRITDFLLFDK
jgi:hypothetical protein